MALLEVGTSTDGSYGQTLYLPKYQWHVCSSSPKKACFGSSQLSSGSPVEVFSPTPRAENLPLCCHLHRGHLESPDFRLMRKFLHFPYLGTDPPETQGFVSSLSPAAAMMNRGSPGEPGAALPSGNLVINTDRGNSPEEIFKDQLEYSRLHSLSWELLKIYVGCMAQETWLVFSFALGKEKGLQIKPTNKL